MTEFENGAHARVPVHTVYAKAHELIWKNVHGNDFEILIWKNFKKFFKDYLQKCLTLLYWNFFCSSFVVLWKHRRYVCSLSPRVCVYMLQWIWEIEVSKQCCSVICKLKCEIGVESIHKHHNVHRLPRYVYKCSFGMHKIAAHTACTQTLLCTPKSVHVNFPIF